MKLLSEKYLSLRCPVCGKPGFHALSLFFFSGKKVAHIDCECGTRKAMVGTKNNRQFWIQVPCGICENDHLYYFAAGEIWTVGLEELVCPDSGQTLGFWGDSQAVREATAELDNSFAAGFDDYFVNPPIMFEILNLLHDIAERKGLYCQCGNKRIEVELYPERLELRCPECRSRNIVYAETEDDLKVMKEVQSIEMAERGFACIDASNFRSIRHRKH